MNLSIRDGKCLIYDQHKVVILVTMGDLLNDIIRLYDMKKFFWLFVFVVLAMQFVAFTTYGSFYWYLGDYSVVPLCLLRTGECLDHNKAQGQAKASGVF